MKRLESSVTQVRHELEGAKDKLLKSEKARHNIAERMCPLCHNPFCVVDVSVKQCSQLRGTLSLLVSPLQDVKASNLMDLELADYQHTVQSLESTLAGRDQELQEARVAVEKQGTVVEELRRQLGMCLLTSEEGVCECCCYVILGVI